MLYLIRFSALMLLVYSFLLFQAALGEADESKEKYHIRHLAELQNSDSVIAPATPVHPLHALYNREAIIPPQCYTRTEGKYNPCYVCHQNQLPNRENVMNDRDLQEAYSFSDIGLTNHWRNLFEDKKARINRISDKEIIEWVNTNNYSDLAGNLKNAEFKGWLPDLDNLHLGAGAFDELGFAKDGSNWVAFNYKPMPSTFWPTNGSTDDVMIRLPAVYRQDKTGNYSRDVYLANLSIVEASIKGLGEISTPPINESVIGADLNGDNRLGVITSINRILGYVGKARDYFFEQGIYPLDTEFLHTVRYIGVNERGDISVSIRMKEVRYMKKAYVLPKFALVQKYTEEHWDKDMGRLPGYINAGAHGLDNEMGWQIQGFIEGSSGQLRTSTFEENMFCMGCHNSIGSTIDKTFSFPRKVDGAAGWGYINLKGMPDAPNRGESKGEIATYFERVGSSEFRNNDEVDAQFFNKEGNPDQQKIAAAKDVYSLITPSKKRALQLNKAYKLIVEDQDYIYGRDAIIEPPENVYDHIDNLTTPTLEQQFIYDWDIRLAWPESKMNFINDDSQLADNNQ